MSILRIIFCILNVLLCVYLFYKASKAFLIYDDWILFHGTEAPERPLQCFNKPKYRLTYQHGKYWVLSNVRAVQIADFHCRGQVSVTMQGYYTDVNNLLRLGTSMFDIMYISFAVFVPNKEHAMRIVDILRFMQYCEHESGELMAVHLYFLHRQNSIDVASFQRKLRKPHFMSECNKLGIAMANSSKVNLEENANAIIVGRNIAQLEAETLFVLPFAGQEIPSQRVMDGIFDFLYHIARCKERERLKKTIFFLPSILTNVFNEVNRHKTSRSEVKEAIKRANKENNSSIPFYIDAGDADWLNTIQDFQDCSLGHHMSHHRITDALQHLLAFPGNFLTLSNYEFPLLEENHQLSVLNSLRLRVFELLLKQFEFIKHQRLFVLQNASSFEKHGDFKLTSFNASILRQYRIMYGPSATKRSWGIDKAMVEYVTFDTWEKFQKHGTSQRPLQCFNQPQYGLTYQHGSYWVLSNIRIAKRSSVFHCSAEVSATLQGYYTDVNNLLSLASSMFDRLRISFAVYVPSHEHAMRIVDIMRYAQYCQQQEKWELMAVHLYFRHHQNSIDVVNLRWELRKPHFMSECYHLGVTLANSSQAKLGENANAIIVGKNIAQLEAETLFVVPFAGQEIPSARLLGGILDSLKHITRCKEEDRVKKTVFFLPSILTKVLGNINRHKSYRLNVKDDIKNANEENNSSKPFYVDAADVEWLNSNKNPFACSLGRHRFSDNIQHFLTFPGHFLTLSNYEFPLLEENHQLSVLSSLRLRVFELLLKQFEFIKHFRLFVLQNVSSFEMDGDFKLTSFNASILRQYRIMYGPSDTKRN